MRKPHETFEERKAWLEKKFGEDYFDGAEDDVYEFYYKFMWGNRFTTDEAEGYAWLNTLFRYDIGRYEALAILRWLYENGQDPLALEAKDKGTLEAICNELDSKIDFTYFAETTPEKIKYSDWSNGEINYVLVVDGVKERKVFTFFHILEADAVAYQHWVPNPKPSGIYLLRYHISVEATLRNIKKNLVKVYKYGGGVKLLDKKRIYSHAKEERRGNQNI